MKVEITLYIPSPSLNDVCKKRSSLKGYVDIAKFIWYMNHTANE